MNLADYEAIAADPDAVEKIRRDTFYAMGKAKNSQFVAVWVRVPESEKVAAGIIGLAAIYALVDDYTTPGCKCDYCTWEGETDHGRLIMCLQRWDKLSTAERMQIAESIEG